MAVEEMEFDAALLDVNLSGETVYPVAEILAFRNIPFAFITGYGTSALSSKYAKAPILHKPIDQQALQDLLVQGHPSLARLA